MSNPAHHRTGVSRSLYEAFRERIMDGTYAAGSTLPSTRALALERGVSRTSVNSVYDQLRAEGLIDSRPGTVSRVARGAALPAGGRQTGPGVDTRTVPAGPLSAIGQRVAALTSLATATAPSTGIDFAYGPLAGSDYPIGPWLKALRAVERQRSTSLAYEDPRGNLALRDALQTHLSQTRALTCTVDQLVIVNGSQQALDLCARLLVDSGDVVVIENPGYRMAHHAFASYGATLRCVDVDDHGMMTQTLPAIGPARMAYVTPTHQFPLGAFLPAGRRRQLLDWASTHRAWIIEDDYDSEYRYTVRPEATLQSLDTEGRVIHVGTFSKTLSPQLRLGYLVLPPALVDLFAGAKRLTDRHAASGTQRALALLLRNGSYDRHVRRIRRLQQARRHALLAALDRHLGEEVDVQGTASGLHVVVWLRRLDARAEPALVRAAQALDVRVYPLSPAYHPSPSDATPLRRAGLIMGYASLPPAVIDEGIRRLAQAVQAVEPWTSAG